MTGVQHNTDNTEKLATNWLPSHPKTVNSFHAISNPRPSPCSRVTSLPEIITDSCLEYEL